MLSMWFNTIPLQEDIIKYTYICHLLYILLEYYVGKQECFLTFTLLYEALHRKGLNTTNRLCTDRLVNVHTVLTIFLLSSIFW